MVQGFNCGNPCNDNSMLLLLLLLCPGLFGGMCGCGGKDNMLFLILILCMCGGSIC